MQESERLAPLEKRLNALATQLADQAWKDPQAANSAYLTDTAATLSEFALQLENEYVRVRGGEQEDVPTNAQGVALARFLRPAFRDKTAGAHVSHGSAGLPDDYVYVRLSDGYEGGIDPEGRVSS